MSVWYKRHVLFVGVGGKKPGHTLSRRGVRLSEETKCCDQLLEIVVNFEVIRDNRIDFEVSVDNSCSLRWLRFGSDIELKYRWVVFCCDRKCSLIRSELWISSVFVDRIDSWDQRVTLEVCLLTCVRVGPDLCEWIELCWVVFKRHVLLAIVGGNGSLRQIRHFSADCRRNGPKCVRLCPEMWSTLRWVSLRSVWV